MNYEEARNYIAHIQGNLGSDYSLKEVTRLAEYMDRPDKKLQIVHIAGTNGKGSAGNYLAGILAASGYRVGRYVSPTTHYLERVQKWEPYTEQAVTISAQEAAKLLTKLRVFCEQMVKEGYHHPTAFEIETILAMQQGVDWNVDVMLVECGLGGRMDATNFITDPLLCMITSISRDHMAVLGETVTEIAEEKYGIIKKGAQVVSAPSKELQPLLERVCRETGAHLHLVQSVGQVQIHSCEETQFYYSSVKQLFVTIPAFPERTKALHHLPHICPCFLRIADQHLVSAKMLALRRKRECDMRFTQRITICLEHLKSQQLQQIFSAKIGVSAISEMMDHVSVSPLLRPGSFSPDAKIKVRCSTTEVKHAIYDFFIGRRNQSVFLKSADCISCWFSGSLLNLKSFHAGRIVSYCLRKGLRQTFFEAAQNFLSHR